jgi:hypothetical protein
VLSRNVHNGISAEDLWWICALLIRKMFVLPIFVVQDSWKVKQKYVTATWRFSAYVFRSGTSHEKGLNIFQIPYYLPMYMTCSKSIWPLAWKITFIPLEVCNPNPLQSSLLVTEHTSPSSSAIVRGISVMPFVNGVQLGHRVPYNVISWLKSSPFQLHFQVGEQSKIERSHVGRVGCLSNHRNVVFGQESFNQLRGMSWCVPAAHASGLLRCTALRMRRRTSR